MSPAFASFARRIPTSKVSSAPFAHKFFLVLPLIPPNIASFFIRVKTNIRSLATADTHKLQFTLTANTAYFVHRIDFTTNAQENNSIFIPDQNTADWLVDQHNDN